MNLELKQGLTTEQLLMIESEIGDKKKNKTVAWLLWFFLGGVGGHRFYLGQTGMAIGMIAVWIISWFLLFIPIAIWALVDAFFINKTIEEHNRKIERDAILRVKGATTQKVETE